jgi:hypothetical protein
MAYVSRLGALIRIDCIYLTIKNISKWNIFRYNRKRTVAKHFFFLLKSSYMLCNLLMFNSYLFMLTS